MSDLLVLYRDERNMSIHSARVTLPAYATEADIPQVIANEYGPRDGISRIKPEEVRVIRALVATDNEARNRAALETARAETFEADAAKLRELVNARTPVITEAQIAAWYDGPAKQLRANAAAWLAGEDR